MIGDHNAMVTIYDPDLAASIRRLLDSIGYVGSGPTST